MGTDSSNGKRQPPAPPTASGTDSSSGDHSNVRTHPGDPDPPPPSPDDPVFPAPSKLDPYGRRARPVLVPNVNALPGGLDIARALRPFGRRHPAPHRRILDEDATVEAAARYGFVRPVLLPLPERWFDVALVVDASRSMDAWKKIIEEFEQLLARQGAFAHVRSWRLSVSDAVVIESAGGQRRAPSALHDPRGRTLILLATNGVAAFWDGQVIARVLDDWSARAPVAILQVFSESRWSHTVIGLPTRRVRAMVPGTASASLAVERKPWEHTPAGRKLLAIPVLSLTPESIACWAEAIMATGRNPTPAVVFAPGLAEPNEDTGSLLKESPDPRTRVERFRGIASREAFRLVCHLAAVPVTLPVMRIVHQQLCRRPAIEDLGEVLASGLLERLTSSSERVDPDAVLYDFGVGIRDVLLGALPMESALDIRARVQTTLKAFIERQLGRAIGNFRAFVLDERGEYTLPPEVKAFVEIERGLLQGLRPQRRAAMGPGGPGSRDCAVVVGVNRYRWLPSLLNAEHNAMQFAEWLGSPGGGGLHAGQMRLLLCPQTAEEVNQALRSVCEAMQRRVSGGGAPSGRRLYLCCIGHGVPQPDGRRGLLLPEASPQQPLECLDPYNYIEREGYSGFFEEVFIVVDCSDDLPVGMDLRPPERLDRIYDGDRLPARQLMLYGSGIDVPEAGRRGFIQSLTAGLSGAAAKQNGDITVDSLRDYLKHTVSFNVKTRAADDWILAHVEPYDSAAIIQVEPILAGTSVMLDGRPLDATATNGWTVRIVAGSHVIELPEAGIRVVFEHPQSNGSGARVQVSWALRGRVVLVAGTGSYELSEPELWMSQAVGRAFAVAGFSLLTGGWQGVDHVVAAAYAEQILLAGIPLDESLTQIVAQGRRPSFEGGRVIDTQQDFDFPSPADGVVLIGGKGGTFKVFQHALANNERAYPIPGTGGDARQAYEQLLSDTRYDERALRQLEAPIGSPDAARHIAHTLVATLLATSGQSKDGPPETDTADITSRSILTDEQYTRDQAGSDDDGLAAPWTANVVVIPDGKPVLQRDLPAGWRQVVVVPVDASGNVRLNGELRSRLGLPEVVAPPASGSDTLPGRSGLPDVTWISLMTSAEPADVRETLASNLQGLFQVCSNSTRVRIWLPLPDVKSGVISREETLGIILRTMNESDLASGTDVHLVIRTDPDIETSKLFGLRVMVEQAAGRPRHDASAALSQAGIVDPAEEIVALIQLAARLSVLQRRGLDNGRINTRLALLALLTIGTEPNFSPNLLPNISQVGNAMREAWNGLAPDTFDWGRVAERYLTLSYYWPFEETGPVVFSRDFSQMLHSVIAHVDGVTVRLFDIANALLDQASRKETGARRVLQDWNIDPIAMRKRFGSARGEIAGANAANIIFQPVGELKGGDPSYAILKATWDHSGSMLATCWTDHTVRIWNVANQEPICSLSGHEQGVNKAAWSPPRQPSDANGNLFATCSFDHTIRIWSARSWEFLRLLAGHAEDIPDIAWSPDGRLLASASSDKTVRIWDVETGEAIATWDDHTDAVMRVIWLPDDGLLASASWDGTIRIRRIHDTSGQRSSHIWIGARRNAALPIDISPDGAYLASCTEDGAIEIWDWRKVSLVRKLPARSFGSFCRSVTFSYDGTMIAVNGYGRRGKVSIWRFDTSELVAEFDEATSGFWPSNIVWAPSRPILATLGDEDRMIRLWRFTKTAS